MLDPTPTLTAAEERERQERIWGEIKKDDEAFAARLRMRAKRTASLGSGVPDVSILILELQNYIWSKGFKLIVPSTDDVSGPLALWKEKQKRFLERGRKKGVKNLHDQFPIDKDGGTIDEERPIPKWVDPLFTPLLVHWRATNGAEMDGPTPVYDDASEALSKSLNDWVFFEREICAFLNAPHAGPNGGNRQVNMHDITMPIGGETGEVPGLHAATWLLHHEYLCKLFKEDRQLLEQRSFMRAQAWWGLRGVAIPLSLQPYLERLAECYKRSRSPENRDPSGASYFHRFLAASGSLMRWLECYLQAEEMLQASAGYPHEAKIRSFLKTIGQLQFRNAGGVHGAGDFLGLQIDELRQLIVSRGSAHPNWDTQFGLKAPLYLCYLILVVRH